MIAVWFFFIFCVFSADSVIKVVSKGVTPSGFSCEGRISGYYADVETGCQTYHFCDGNRHYSYVCPNGTLFQQRMMVCFHAYMVDCRNSEKDYAANLLIGREKEPFVKDFVPDKITPPRKFVTNVLPPKPSTINPPPKSFITPRPTVISPSPISHPPSTRFHPEPFDFQPKSSFRLPPAISLQPSGIDFQPKSSSRLPPAIAKSPFSNLPPAASLQPEPSAFSNLPPKPSVTFLPPFENTRQSKSSKDSVIKLILSDTRDLFFIPSQNSSTGEDLKTVQEFFIPVENQITNFRFKKNPAVENGCPSYCHPKFLIPGTCHPCLMIK